MTFEQKTKVLVDSLEMKEGSLTYMISKGFPVKQQRQQRSSIRAAEKALDAHLKSKEQL